MEKMGNPVRQKSSDSEKAQRKIKVSSFFAGIGGFDFGFELAGAKSVFHCEIDEFCQKILARHWPDTKLATDIRLLQANAIPASDVWCGGFPCQDVSLARGHHGRDGLKGKNTGLFFSFIDLVATRKPKVIILENVTGLLNSHNGHDFQKVVKSLTDIGYGVAWRVLNSRYFGAPQSRPRVYICAWLGNPAAAVSALFEKERSDKPSRERTAFLAESKVVGTQAIVAEVAYCLAATSGRHTGTDWSRTYVSYPARVRRLTPTECEGLQGFPTDWTSIEWNSKDAEEIDSLRYQALGNAVTVNVVHWIAKRIVSSDSLRGTKTPTITDWVTSISDYLNFYSPIRNRDLCKLIGDEKIQWKSSGCAFNDSVYDFSAPTAPAQPVVRILSSVIERVEPATRYFLSPNAAIGILRRVENQNRTLFAPMDKALRRLAGLLAKKTKESKHRFDAVRSGDQYPLAGAE